MTYRDWDQASSKTNYKRRWEASQRMLTRVMHENRVRDECLEIATKALEWYGRNGPVLLCGKAGGALEQIEARLAELEPEEKSNVET